MKKTYAAILTLFILTIASFLTYISNTDNKKIPTSEVASSTEKTYIEKNQGIVGANPDVMKLNMQTWTWISTTYSDGKIIKPNNGDRFKLTFSDKTFSASTDCNGIGGEYFTNDNSIKFDKMMSTLMYCEGSQESEFSKSLSEVSSYHFTNKGELVFDLKYDSGVMIFR